jgi:hypothetical protein
MWRGRELPIRDPASIGVNVFDEKAAASRWGLVLQMHVRHHICVVAAAVARRCRGRGERGGLHDSVKVYELVGSTGKRAADK